MYKDYSGQNLRGRFFKGQNLEGADFSNALAGLQKRSCMVRGEISSGAESYVKELITRKKNCTN
jgi:uncharacterized protein YjbI with pentapeptide repeats